MFSSGTKRLLFWDRSSSPLPLCHEYKVEAFNRRKIEKGVVVEGKKNIKYTHVFHIHRKFIPERTRFFANLVAGANLRDRRIRSTEIFNKLSDRIKNELKIIHSIYFKECEAKQEKQVPKPAESGEVL